MKKMSGMKALEMDEMPEPVRYHVGPESVKSVKRSGVKVTRKNVKIATEDSVKCENSNFRVKKEESTVIENSVNVDKNEDVKYKELIRKEFEILEIRRRENEKFAQERWKLQCDKIKRREIEILNYRQKLYSVKNRGENVDEMLKTFRSKVVKFLRDYGRNLDTKYEKMWRDKIVITEKAVGRRESDWIKVDEKYVTERILAVEEIGNRNVTHEAVEIIPDVKMLLENAEAQEMLIENLPEPPKEDEIEEALLRLKRFNKKWLDNENCTPIEEKIRVAESVVKEVEETGVSKVDRNGSEIVKVKPEKADDKINEEKKHPDVKLNVNAVMVDEEAVDNTDVEREEEGKIENVEVKDDIESENLDNKLENAAKVPQVSYENEHDESPVFDDGEETCVNESDENYAAGV